ncbi:MAG: hypothetical protein MUE66_08370, partial [Acidimicrobiia bacterium]|nr:hypothetical protein [Acidimicrobiia bacterium]
MAEQITFVDPTGESPPVSLARATLPPGLPDGKQRAGKIPKADPYYIDLGMLYKLACLEQVRREKVTDTPLHVALRGHMGTGKDHDLEQFAALLGLP